jgi:hypothetical protein
MPGLEFATPSFGRPSTHLKPCNNVAVKYQTSVSSQDSLKSVISTTAYNVRLFFNIILNKALFQARDADVENFYLFVILFQWN